MSILRRIGSAFALVWQIARLSLPENLNKTNIGAFLLVGVLGATVVIFYLTSPRPLKISEYAAGGTAVPEALKVPAAKEPGPVAPSGPAIDPSQLGRFPYPLPEKSPFEVARPGPVAQTPGQEQAKSSVAKEPNKISSPKTSVIENEYKEEINPSVMSNNTSDIKIDRSPSSKMYETQIVFGPTTAVRTIFFFWSASSNESVSEFRKHIFPLIKKIASLKIRIVLSQVFDPRFHDANGSGAMLVCPDKYADYVKAVVRYLSKASKVDDFSFEKDVLLYKNSSIDQLVKDRTLNLIDCKNASFHARQVLLYQKTNIMLSRFKIPPPIYVMEDTVYTPNDPMINRLLLSR